MTVDTDTGDVLVNQVSFTRVELIISNQILIVLCLSKLTWNHTDDYIPHPGVDLLAVQLLVQPFLEPGRHYHILFRQCTSIIESGNNATTVQEFISYVKVCDVCSTKRQPCKVS